jgi:hypothetical protein
MADGTAGGVADSLLGLMLNGAAFAGFATPFVQLHTGLPGPNGTANVAGNTTRVATGAFARAAAGSWQNSAAINWTAVSTSETYTHATLWSAASAGTFIQSGTIAASPITSGSNFQIAANGLTVGMPVAS